MPFKKQNRGKEVPPYREMKRPWVNRSLAILACTVAPAFLIYLNLRCEKNQCVLYQLPLVIPTHLGAYVSFTAILLLVGFLGLMLLINFIPAKDSSLSPGFSSLLIATFMLLGLAYLKPDAIHAIRAEYLRMLIVATVSSFIISAVLATASWLSVKEGRAPRTWVCCFFLGTNRRLNFFSVELKYFFYVNVGLVALALLDLVLLLDFALKVPLTAPVTFLAMTQYLVVAHTLLFENFMKEKPFMETEKLGFYWLLKTVLYLPFLHSLPVHYAAVTEIVLPKPAMLADCVLFLFGFIIYVSSIHQKENFVQDPSAYKNLKSIPAAGKRLLISGYWGIVQKPDYLGYMIIWLSWIIACGLSGVSLVVLAIIYMTVFSWLGKMEKVNWNNLANGWNRYTNIVPKKVIPFVY